MRCAMGICAMGILGCTGFSLLQWEKGSETPSCGGEKGVSDPLSRENLVHPKIPLVKIPFAQRIKPLTYAFKKLEKKTSAKWISVSDFAVRPRSGRENVAETCTASPDTNLRLTNLRLGNA